VKRRTSQEDGGASLDRDRPLDVLPTIIKKTTLAKASFEEAKLNDAQGALPVKMQTPNDEIVEKETKLKDSQGALPVRIHIYVETSPGIEGWRDESGHIVFVKRLTSQKDGGASLNRDSSLDLLPTIITKNTLAKASLEEQANFDDSRGAGPVPIQTPNEASSSCDSSKMEKLEMQSHQASKRITCACKLSSRTRLIGAIKSRAYVRRRR